MPKKQPQPKDNMRVTIRFRDDVVAEEFHRQAAEANKRPSPFAAQLIERALTERDARDFEHHSLHHELKELRDTLEALGELSREPPDKEADNDELLAELTALRRDVADLKKSHASATEPSDDLRKALTLLRKLQADVAELAALPHVFVKLREDVATGIRPILIRACQLTHEQAEDWIRRNLLEE